MKIHRMEQLSEAWFEIKLGRFSGSTIRSLLMSKGTAEYQNCIANVVAEILTQERDNGYTSYDMQRGSDLEPDARKYYEQLFDVKVEEVGFIESTDERFGEYAGVSPDGLINGDGMLEIKCPKANTMFKYYAANQLPANYKAQVQFQLYVAERKYCDFMAYYPKLKPFIIRVFPDVEYQKRLVDELIKAVDEVKKQIKLYKEYDYEL